MSQPLSYHEIEMWHGHPGFFCLSKLEEIFNTPDDSDTGYFVEVYLRYPDKIKERTWNFPFSLENNFVLKDKYND